MLKKNKFMRPAACTLAVLAALAIIIACGEGDIINVDVGETNRDLADAQKNLEDNLENIVLSQSNESSSSGEIELSSSSDNTDTSSSSGNEAGTSSSSNIELSSSNVGSSSSSLVASSSSVPGASSSSNTGSLPFAFSCNWKGDYPIILLGDQIFPEYSGDSDKMAEAECGEPAFRTQTEVGAFAPYDMPVDAALGIKASITAGDVHRLQADLTCGSKNYNNIKCDSVKVIAKPPYTPPPSISCVWEVQPFGEVDYVEKNISTAGDNVRIKYTFTDELEGCGNAIFSGSVFAGAGIQDGDNYYSPVGAPGANVASNTVKANLACSKDRYSDTTYALNCPSNQPLTVTAVPTPKKKGGSISLELDYSSSSSNIYFMGSTPSIKSNTVTYDIDVSEAENCGEVGDSIVIVGNMNTPAQNAVKAYATVKCRNTVYLLDSARANIVNNPAWQTGASAPKCEWDTKNNAFGGLLTAEVKAMPNLSSINSNYGRCDVPYLTRDGSFWDGKVDEWMDFGEQTMENLGIASDCADGSKLTLECSDITVVNPDDMCEYSKFKLCGNLPIESVRVGTDFGPQDNNRNGNPESCTYVTSITQLRFGNVEITDPKGVFVNGKKGSIGNLNGGKAANGCANNADGLENCTTFLADIEKIDDGYYIYINSNDMHNNGVTVGSVTQLAPLCRP